LPLAYFLSRLSSILAALAEKLHHDLDIISHVDAAPGVLSILITERFHALEIPDCVLFMCTFRQDNGQFRFRCGSGLGIDRTYHEAFHNVQILDGIPMSSNPSIPLPALAGHFYALPLAQVVRLSGADALVFAHAQFASDVQALNNGQWQWSTWLTAKGRVIAVFQLIRLDELQLLLLCHDGHAAMLAEALRGFIFRRKVQICCESWSVAAAFQAPQYADGAVVGRLPENEQLIELDMGSTAYPRCLRLGAAIEADSNPDFAMAWRQADLRFGLPRLDASPAEQWTPQHLGLERLTAYSVKKGCYPGQEIVARTHFLGKAKRATQLLELAAPAVPGTAVMQHDKNIGALACCAGHLALAVLPLDQDLSVPLQVNATAARPLPLWEGLKR